MITANKAFLVCFWELLDAVFKFAGMGAIPGSVLPDQFEWPFAFQVFCPPAAGVLVFAQAAVDIGSDAGVQTVVCTPDDINKPLTHR